MSTSLSITPKEAVEPFIPKQFPQIIATIIAATASFSLGTSLVWTSPSIPDLERKGVFGEMSLSDKSWIASLLTLGALCCGPFSAYIVDRCGRRASIMILTIPMTLGWILISSGLSVTVMCIGRFLVGFAVGGNCHVMTVYVSEISQEKIRGILMSITYVACGLGILYIYVLGSFASWFILSVTNILCPVVLFIGMYFLPESYIHLINKGKTEEAGKALLWFRGAENLDQIQIELNQLRREIEQSKEQKSEIEDGLINAILTKNSLKALGISLTLMMCQQLSGVNAVLFFTLSIFEAAGTNIDPNVSSIIIGIVIVFSVFLNTALVDRVGRRVLMITSELGMTLALFSLGTFFYLKKQNGGITPDGLSFMPLISLVSFVILYNVGAGPLPWLMMGELLPPRIKGFGCGLSTSFNWMLAFLVTKTFESLIPLLEIHGCYFMFGSICILGLLFAIFFVPETKGKTFDEIQELYFSN